MHIAATYFAHFRRLSFFFSGMLVGGFHSSLLHPIEWWRGIDNYAVHYYGEGDGRECSLVGLVVFFFRVLKELVVLLPGTWLLAESRLLLFHFWLNCVWF